MGPRDRAEPARPCVAVERQGPGGAVHIARTRRRTPPVALPLTRLDKNQDGLIYLLYCILYLIKRRSRVARA